MQTSTNNRVTRYQATVPDTLDLAERAGLAINALTGSADERFFYESCQCSHLDHQTPYMNWVWNGPCMPKPLHALPLLRAMSGSTQNADIDEKMLEAITRDIDDDGLWWMKVENRPWRQETMGEDQVWPCVQGRLIVALLDRHRVDGDPRWMELAGRLTKGLIKIALPSDEVAWYYTAYKRTGWGTDDSASAEMFGKTAAVVANEPETSGNGDIGIPLRAISRWYEVSGDAEALDLADRLARFYLKHWTAMGWSQPVPAPEMLVSAEHGHFQGHLHERTFGVMGLLEYARVRRDTRIMRFVQESYEYARCFGIARMGYFPAVLRPVAPRQDLVEAGIYLAADGSAPQCNEGCAVADMIWLAANLSKAGVGDYWDDVDQYTRNHLVEHQLTRRDLIEAMVAAGPAHKIDPRKETDERVIERNIGAFFSGGDPTWHYGWWTMCCTGNCSVALHDAWDSILSHQDGVVQVNLLLNRSSAWLDVDSYLPYEGKVVLKNKTAHTVYLRKPLWAERDAFNCRVDGKSVSLHWVDNYLAVTNLSGGEDIVVEFPMVETTETYTLPTYPGPYTLRMRGNTVVDISPRPQRPAIVRMSSDDGDAFDVKAGYPIYLRDELGAGGPAPVKTIERNTSPFPLRFGGG